MSTHPLSDISVLDQFRTKGAFPPGYHTDKRTFYSPIDDLHGALKFVLSAAQNSIVIAMFGFDDDELAGVLLEKLNSENVYVQLTLDSSQAGGVHEKKLLAQDVFPMSSVAVGRSEKGAIMHMKEGVIDGTIHFTGSTNWSTGGESLQDNQLTIEIDPVASVDALTRIGAIHSHMLNAGKSASSS